MTGVHRLVFIVYEHQEVNLATFLDPDIQPSWSKLAFSAAMHGARLEAHQRHIGRAGAAVRMCLFPKSALPQVTAGKQYTEEHLARAHTRSPAHMGQNNHTS